MGFKSGVTNALEKVASKDKHPVLFFFCMLFLSWFMTYAIGPSVLLYIAYAVLFFLFIPWSLGFFLNDDAPYIERLKNPTYIVISIIQLLVIYLYQSGAFLLQAVQTIMQNAAVLYPIIFLNAWGVYILFTYASESKFLWIVRLVFILFVTILMLIQIFAFLSTNNMNLAGRNYGLVSMQSVWKGVQDAFKNALSAIPTTIGTIRDEVNKSIAIATGQYYVGEVEKGKNEPLGVFIKNVRPIDSILLYDKPVIIIADVSGQSFQGAVDVTVGCLARSSDNKFYTGEVSACGIENSPLFRITYKDTCTVYCTFNSIPQGSYSIQLTAEFPFQTWAYIPYTFVDQKTYNGYYAQGKDINKELAIEQKPIAVYTSGPVSIGLQTQDQPVPLDTSRLNSDRVFGGTVENRGTEGTIKKVDEFVLKIPKPFTIDPKQCYPPSEKMPTEDTQDAGYTAYTFTNVDPRIVFSTVMCRLRVTSDDSTAMLSGKVKAEKTFVAQASYVYVTTKTITVQVQ